MRPGPGAAATLELSKRPASPSTRPSDPRQRRRAGRIPGTRDRQARHRRGRRWLLLLIAGLVTLLLPAVLAACESAAATESDRPASFGIDLSWPADLLYPSERTLKADQIEALGYDPQVIFFGGSRSVRFDPAYLKKKTGLPGYNLAMTNGKAEDAFVFAHFLHNRAPTSAPLWIWGVQKSLLLQQGPRSWAGAGPTVEQVPPHRAALDPGEAPVDLTRPRSRRLLG